MVILLNPLVMSPDDSPERNLETTGHAPKDNIKERSPLWLFPLKIHLDAVNLLFCGESTSS